MSVSIEKKSFRIGDGEKVLSKEMKKKLFDYETTQIR